jgi:hypothetical protein
MNTNFNFKSQVCTDKVQSERLLALGLKKETADMVWLNHALTEEYDDWKITALEEWDGWYDGEIPAWSLHRLIEIVAHTQYPYYVISKELPIYDALCERIEWLIKEGYFQKEYLV